MTALWLARRGGQERARRQLARDGRVLGRLAALWSADLLLIQVVLMARIPLVERSFGQDTLARWHRWTGFASFHLLLAHVVLAVLADERPDQADRELLVDDLVDGLRPTPGCWLATGGPDCRWSWSS